MCFLYKKHINALDIGNSLLDIGRLETLSNFPYTFITFQLLTSNFTNVLTLSSYLHIFHSNIQFYSNNFWR